MRILGIESSCDDTGVAIYDSDSGLLSHALMGQSKMHNQFGGIVPELASRDHTKNILPLIKSVMDESDSKPRDITGIAYTAGPGLVGALMVGASTAEALSMAWHVPTVAVHHMEGHMLSPLLDEKQPTFPFLALLVSGGHTLLVKVRQIGDYEVLGESIDDAAGEAFDKTAKLMGLPYPGGPIISILAKSGQKGRFTFPLPMVDRPGLNFSFSGLKTFARNTWNKTNKTEQDKADIAFAFEEAIVKTLSIKVQRALKLTGFNQVVVAGGVSANTALRSQLNKIKDTLDIEIFYPSLEFCTDNGAMIALAGCFRFHQNKKTCRRIVAKPRWPISQL